MKTATNSNQQQPTATNSNQQQPTAPCVILNFVCNAFGIKA